MKTKIIFLRHADTQKDPNINAAKWVLSDIGKKQAEDNSNIKIMQEVDSIYASEEIKTFLTAQPLAQKINKEIISMPDFNEVKRGDKFLDRAGFEEEKKKQLLDLNYHAFGGESGIEAIDRFKRGLLNVKESNKGKTILIVTHGTILNLYFANILNANKSLPERWSKTGFCAYGIMEDGMILKDIID